MARRREARPARAVLSALNVSSNMPMIRVPAAGVRPCRWVPCTGVSHSSGLVASAVLSSCTGIGAPTRPERLALRFASACPAATAVMPGRLNPYGRLRLLSGHRDNRARDAGRSVAFDRRDQRRSAPLQFALSQFLPEDRRAAAAGFPTRRGPHGQANPPSSHRRASARCPSLVLPHRRRGRPPRQPRPPPVRSGRA